MDDTRNGGYFRGRGFALLQEVTHFEGFCTEVGFLRLQRLLGGIKDLHLLDKFEVLTVDLLQGLLLLAHQFLCGCDIGGGIVGTNNTAHSTHWIAPSAIGTTSCPVVIGRLVAPIVIGWLVPVAAGVACPTRIVSSPVVVISSPVVIVGIPGSVLLVRPACIGVAPPAVRRVRRVVPVISRTGVSVEASSKIPSTTSRPLLGVVQRVPRIS